MSKYFLGPLWAFWRNLKSACFLLLQFEPSCQKVSISIQSPRHWEGLHVCRPLTGSLLLTFWHVEVRVIFSLWCEMDLSKLSREPNTFAPCLMKTTPAIYTCMGSVLKVLTSIKKGFIAFLSLEWQREYYRCANKSLGWWTRITKLDPMHFVCKISQLSTLSGLLATWGNMYLSFPQW